MLWLTIGDSEIARAESTEEEKTTDLDAIRNSDKWVFLSRKEFAVGAGDFYRGGTDTTNIRTTVIEPLSQIHNLRLHSTVFENGRSFTENSSHHERLGAHMSLHIEKNLSLMELV